MTSLGTRIRAGLLVLAVVGAGSAYDASAWDTNPLNTVVVSQHHLCGARDLPEAGIQGDVPMADQESGRAQKGYNCGLALVGHATLDAGGRTNSNANMAWAGHCAYVSSANGAVAPQSKPSVSAGSGVAVVDVADSAHPRHIATLRDPGALATSETLNAVTTPSGRSILVVGQYGNDAVSDPKPMDVYDVSDPDCSKFKHLTTYYWPANTHNLTLSADGRYVFATIPLQAADISGLWDDDPRTGVTYLGNLEKEMDGTPVAPGPTADLDDGLPAEARHATHPISTSHEAWVSPDNRTVYVGAQTTPTETFTILDVSKWLQRDADGNPVGPLRVLSQRSSRGHSIRTATIGGKPYLLHSDESPFGAGYGCVPQEGTPFVGPAQPWLTDISDPTNPRTVSQFGLEINQPANCQRQVDAGESDSVHYHDVDDATDTTFAMASMWNAGLRVFDVRNPARPSEVAYFNPGDVDPGASTRLDHAWGHVRYVAETGEIWFATADGGFWVVRLEGQVRRALQLDAKDAAHGRPAVRTPADDAGEPGTLAAHLTAPSRRYADVSPYSCMVAALTSPNRPVG